MSFVQVTIHESQFPGSVRADLLESLRSRQINHKFHYDSVKQTQKWLELHQAYSPSRTDPDCEATYARAFEAVGGRSGKFTTLLGLGCGGGQKDTRLLKLLRQAGANVSYVPCDVSLAMVLIARETALGMLPGLPCHPLVCDLARADDLPDTLANLGIPAEGRLVTFFGMLPNFEPDVILPRLARLVGSGDRLLLSANLAPGPNYGEGVRKILPFYDNSLTREWLMMFLTDIGIDKADGELTFGIEDRPGGLGLKRIVASFRFSRSTLISVGQEEFRFGPGEVVRLFFSYRHTPEIVRGLVNSVGLRVVEEWVTRSGEEGVFLVERPRTGG